MCTFRPTVSNLLRISSKVLKCSVMKNIQKKCWNDSNTKTDLRLDGHRHEAVPHLLAENFRQPHIVLNEPVRHRLRLFWRKRKPRHVKIIFKEKKKSDIFSNVRIYRLYEGSKPSLTNALLFALSLIESFIVPITSEMKIWITSFTSFLAQVKWSIIIKSIIRKTKKTEFHLFLCNCLPKFIS